MVTIVALTVVTASMSARLGREFIDAARLQSAADAVALALATGDRDLAISVAQLNGVRLVDERTVGDADTGFDVTVTVASGDAESRARASSRADPPLLDNSAVPGFGPGALR